MGYWVDKLERPYTVNVLIQAYVYTHRKDFVHQDFNDYYSSLLSALQPLFDVEMTKDSLSFDQNVLWRLFNSTVSSLLQITNPWAGYLEAGLIHTKVEQYNKTEEVREASSRIAKANQASEQAHSDMLLALFTAIFGERSQMVTSEELAEAGFDDSKEPDTSDYFDYM